MTTSGVERDRDTVASAFAEPADASDDVAGATHTAPWGRRVPPWLHPLAAALALPIALYLVLRPENYGLTPNGLDPVFYTGYTFNLDDMIAALGDRWYFVSRWSAYLPAHAIDALAGPTIGRLVWRLLLAATILLLVWELGRRYARNAAQQFLVGTLVLTMPIFVRAFFSDYVEYVVVALGTCLVAVCLRPGQTVRRAVAIGVLSGLVVVANPVSVSVVGLSVLTGLFVGVATWRRRFVLATVTGVAFVAVGIFGLVYFRARFGIDNVYKPTIDFLRTYRPPENDPWRSPHLTWLGAFTWIYVVPILLAGAVLAARVRGIVFDRVEKAALVLCAVQYATHWFDQFVRKGLTLEVSFYWSFAYPTFAIAMVLVVGRLTDGVRPRIVAGLGVTWILLLFVGVPDALRLPSAAGFAAVAVCSVALAGAVARKATWASVAVIVGLVGWTQIGAPGYVPSADTQMNASPRYDSLFRRGGDESEKVLAEAVWFEKQMDRVPGDPRASFVTVGGWASPITGLYAPHVTGRIVPVDGSRERLTPEAVLSLRRGQFPLLAVYGPKDDVARVLPTMARDLGPDLGATLLDATHDDALGYRLVVYATPDASTAPFTWPADILLVKSGQRSGTTVVARPGDVPGVITFGPYVPFRPGRYMATIRYSSSEPASRQVGGFDVSSIRTGVIADVLLPGTGGAEREVSVEFTSNDPAAQYELRSRWDGVGTFTVVNVSYAQP
jgi:hypothetical protein